MIVPVGIALGSNLADRATEINAGITFLHSLSNDGKVKESPWLETTPVDCPPGSPSFLNAFVEIQVDAEQVTPRILLKKLQAFERDRGRPDKRIVNEVRCLDLDIIYYGDLVIDEPDLVIPHPRAHLRRFVLEPLSYVRPELVLPGQIEPVEKLLAAST